MHWGPLQYEVHWTHRHCGSQKAAQLITGHPIAGAVKKECALPTVEQALKWMHEFSKEHNRTDDQFLALEAERAKRGRKTDREWNGAVIAVGSWHGFVVQGVYDRFVVTAAHCLPRLPPCNVGEYDRECLYPSLLGPPGGQQTVAAACCFADPISDIAVLRAPNSVQYAVEFGQFVHLTDAATPLSIAEPPEASLGRIPSPDSSWSSHVVCLAGGRLLIIGDLDKILVEMSGVPIISDQRKAIGVLCPDPERQALGASHPGLVGSLPTHLLRVLGVAGASPAP